MGKATNNRAEIVAACVAIEQAILYEAKELSIYTDSELMVKSIKFYMKKWKANGWKLSDGLTDVKNKEDLLRLDYLCSKMKVKWVGHYYFLKSNTLG